MKKIILYLILFFFTFISISLLGLPIIIDLIFCIVILIILKKNFFSVLIFNLLIVTVIFITNISFGKNQKYEFFYRGHEKYITKNKSYQKNITDTIFMPHGDIYAIDLGFNEKRENIKESRKQKFVTDSYGMRNDKTDIDEADIILVGDSYITGNGTSQEYIPSNTLSKVSGKKVAILSVGGLDSKDYEIFITKYLGKIRKDAKIFIFYFEGNDFMTVKKSRIENFDDTKYFEWGGQKLPIISGKIRIAYERLERNKDKFLLKVLSEKNYFLRNIRAKSHIMYKKFFAEFHNSRSKIKYFDIQNKTVGFYYFEDPKIETDYTTHIIQNKKILERINGVFYIPTKIRVYSPFIESVNFETDQKFSFLSNSYSKLKIPVFNLTEILTESASNYLSNNKYIYWRDDTHWNPNGILEAMNFVNKVLNK